MNGFQLNWCTEKRGEEGCKKKEANSILEITGAKSLPNYCKAISLSVSRDVRSWL
jgi:hypothetical protein